MFNVQCYKIEAGDNRFHGTAWKSCGRSLVFEYSLASDIALIPRNQPIRTSHQATDLSYGDDAAVAGVNWVSRGLLQRSILMAL